MIIINIIILTLFILTGFLGALVLIGLILHFIEKKNMSLIARTFGVGGIIVTGLGTVVHETGHLVMCWIFGHKVIKAELFRPVKFRYDGVLGKVTHSYNKRNFWHTLGNFFIGAGPIIFGLGVIALLLWLLLPETGRALTTFITENGNLLKENASIIKIFKMFFNGIIVFVTSLFSPANLANAGFWIFIILGACIAMHMSLSSADLKGCGKGVAAVIIAAAVISVIMTVFKLELSTGWIISYNVYVVSFLTMGLILSLLILIIMLPLYAVKRRILRNKIRRRFARGSEK